MEIPDISNITLLVMSVIAVIVVASWHRSKDGFQLQQMLVDSKTNKISIEKLGYITALFFGTWALVAQVQHNALTEEYFIGYLTVFAVTRVASMGISVKKDMVDKEVVKNDQLNE